MEFFATCPAGFEHLLASELRDMGIARIRPLKGQVAWEGALSDAYRACLWSRLASRIIAVLARGEAKDADQLYDTVSQVPWEDHLPEWATFAIDAHGTNDNLRNTQFVALRAKDALVDRMHARAGRQPIADVHSADLRVVVRISRTRAVVGIDLSGEPLFRRDDAPRHEGRGQLSPLRPDYAAALLATGGWPEMCRKDSPVILLPYAGNGTLAVEAAGMAMAQAPGLLRHRWGFQGWACHDPGVWDELRDEALQSQAIAHDLRLILSDTRRGYEVANRHALRASGIEVEPEFREGLSDLQGSSPMLLACDLSWVGAQGLAVQTSVLARLGQAAASLPASSRAAVLALDGQSDRVLGAADETTRLYLGRDEACLRRYDAPTDQMAHISLPSSDEVPVLLPTSSQFAARLAKVWRQRRKWARREDVSCYRIYDADLPDYAVSIDLFEGSQTPGRWLQIYEYAAPRGIDAELAQARLMDVMAIAPQVLDVRPQDTFVRVRTKARGGSQYAEEARQTPDVRPNRNRPGRVALPPGAHLVDEGGLTFEVNFSTRLDCGIFLDHRDTRSMLREMAKQTKGSKRFLNLFAYTGTGTCYAADGGMRHTTTVDLSRPSLDWARRNMARNGFDGPEHEYVQADVIAWVSEQRRTRNRWDLVFCDVPTFSNSSRMRKASFDVQRDHAELLIGVSRLLTRDGTCVFSCNLRNFRLDEEALSKAGVQAQDITSDTIPDDFSRNPRIHHCYLVRRTPREGQG